MKAVNNFVKLISFVISIFVISSLAYAVEFRGSATERFEGVYSKKKALAALKKLLSRRSAANAGGGSGGGSGGGTPMALGGVVTSPTLGYLGEAGSEYVIPARKAAICRF